MHGLLNANIDRSVQVICLEPAHCVDRVVLSKSVKKRSYLTSCVFEFVFISVFVYQHCKEHALWLAGYVSIQPMKKWLSEFTRWRKTDAVFFCGTGSHLKLRLTSETESTRTVEEKRIRNIKHAGNCYWCLDSSTLQNKVYRSLNTDTNAESRTFQYSVSVTVSVS